MERDEEYRYGRESKGLAEWERLYHENVARDFGKRLYLRRLTREWCGKTERIQGIRRIEVLRGAGGACERELG